MIAVGRLHVNRELGERSRAADLGETERVDADYLALLARAGIKG